MSDKREGPGRPSLGVTKKISVTLPESVWNQVEKEIKDQNMKSISAYFRKLSLDYFKKGDT